MTALNIALAGYLAFGQPTGDAYESITKHAGLQVIHADGAVTLRLREEETGGSRSGATADADRAAPQSGRGAVARAGRI